MGLQNYDQGQPITYTRDYVAGNGTSQQGLVAAILQNALCTAILCGNSDSIAHVVEVHFLQGGADILIGSATIPIGQGTAGTPSLDLLALVLPATVIGITIPPNCQLTVKCVVAVTGSNHVYFLAQTGLLG